MAMASICGVVPPVLSSRLAIGSAVRSCRRSRTPPGPRVVRTRMGGEGPVDDIPLFITGSTKSGKPLYSSIVDIDLMHADLEGDFDYGHEDFHHTVKMDAVTGAEWKKRFDAGVEEAYAEDFNFLQAIIGLYPLAFIGMLFAEVDVNIILAVTAGIVSVYTLGMQIKSMSQKSDLPEQT